MGMTHKSFDTKVSKDVCYVKRDKCNFAFTKLAFLMHFSGLLIKPLTLKKREVIRKNA